MPKDILVIGAGAVGLCCALDLQQSGHRVTVLTRERVGEGASSGNAGMLAVSLFTPLSAPGVVAQGLRWLFNPTSPFHIRPRLDRDLMRWLWTFRAHANEQHVAHATPILRDLSLASVRAFAELENEIGPIGFEESGLLMVYRTEAKRADHLALADRAEAAGLTVERLDRDALLEREPNLRTPAEGAVFFKEDGRVDSDALLARLKEALIRRGVEIREGVAVETLHAHGDRIAGVHTSEGRIDAEELVVAAGAWTSRLARSVGVRIPVQPAKGYSITLPAPDDVPRIPLLMAEEKATVTPMIGRLRFTGTLALTGFDASVDMRRAAVLKTLARAYCPDADLEKAGVWSGFRPASPDGLPIVGRSPRHRNLTFATGHGMMGVTLAPATGALVAGLIDGHAPPAALRVNRF